MRTLLVFLCLSCSIAVFGQNNCNYFNYTVTPPVNPYISVGIQEHKFGYSHAMYDSMGFGCHYQGTANPDGPTPCVGTADASSVVTWHDGQHLSRFGFTHYGSVQHASSTKTGTAGSSVPADTEGAAAIRSCLVSCSEAITITGGGKGGGFSVAFSPQPLWGDEHHYGNTCVSATLPPSASTTCPSPDQPYPGQTTGNGYYDWDTTSCQWVWVSCPANFTPNQCGGSPIILDTLKTGFKFNDPHKYYITFDLKGNGTYMKLSWPKVGSGNAWLVYDRDGDGVIKDGMEMFGNYSPHSDCDRPDFIKGKDKNGFCSLQWFDHLTQGGNQDGMLDKHDTIWKKLRLWIDTHCYQNPDVPCQSLPSELHTLDSLGVHSLSLYYNGDPTKHDSIGNEFRFYAVVNPEIHDAPINKATGRHIGSNDNAPFERSKDGRLMWDVYLTTIQ